MIDESVLHALLKDACRAPSGDNVQPWRFRYVDSVLSIYNIPGVHNPHLDFEERGAYIAHGALIENLCIAAPHYGYEATVTLFPDTCDADLVAHVSLKECNPHDDPLYAAIPLRATNRHPYKNKSISTETLAALAASAEPFPAVELVLAESRKERAALAHAASRAEIVILAYEPATEHFFADMVWTLEEEREKKAGFFVKSLEFNPVQALVFWLASKPRVMHFFRTVGLPRFIANQDAKLYATGAISGGLLIRDESRESYVTAGRALERLWLTATARGLAFQPLIGTSFIAYKVETERSNLPAHLAKEMHDAFTSIQSHLGAGNRIPAFLFRTGLAPAPSTYSSRREPDIAFV